MAATAEQIILDPVVPPFGASAYWPLDARNGFADVSGNGYTGTAQGGVTAGGAATAPPGLVGATDFDGSNDYLLTSYNPLTIGSSRSFAGWGYRDASATSDVLVGSNDSDGIYLTLGPASQDVSFQPQNGVATATTWTAAWPGNTTWTHWALVFLDGSNSVSLYINGALVSAQTQSGTYSASPGNFLIGAYQAGASPIDGRLAAVGVWERELTPPEIATLYQRGLLQANLRTEFDLTPWVAQAGIDWGDAEIAAFMAEGEFGELKLDSRVPNRTISGGLIFTTRGTVTAQQGRAQAQAKFAALQRDGGQLRRVTNSGTAVYADVVDAGFHATSTSGVMSSQGLDPEASFTLQTLPDFYGTERQLIAETTGTHLLSPTATGVKGNYPARCRIEAYNTTATTQQSLVYALRARSYSTDTTNHGFFYEVEDSPWSVTGAGSSAVLAGASGGDVVTGACTTSWQNWALIRLDGLVGSFRVIARTYSSTASATLYARLAYSTDDAGGYSYNDQVTILSSSQFGLVDLGQLTLVAPPVGMGTTLVYLQGKGAAGAENLRFDCVYLLPVDEGGCGMVTGSTASALEATGYLEVTTDGAWRSGGTVKYRGVERVIYGALPRLPIPPGGESGTVQLLARMGRGVVGTGFGLSPTSDAAITDSFTVRLHYNPCWLFVE